MTSEKRKALRAPILTQVETQGERLSLSALGRASNISVGGLLIETPDTLAEGMTAIIRFFLPPGQPIEVAGRVVRSDQGKSMAIAFLGLPDSHRQRIVNYVMSIQEKTTELDDKLLTEPRSSSPRQRRSGRIPRRVAVVLAWTDEEGHPRQEAAVTQLLSQYGALVLMFSELKPAQLLRLTVSDSGKEVPSRVVWAKAALVPGRVEIGLEFVGSENFWGLEFPADQLSAPETPHPTRRRSARLPRRIDVVLTWVDKMGQAREGNGQTQLVSKHGASVSSEVAVPEKQLLRLRAPAMNAEADSRIVWARPGSLPGRTDLGIEFQGTDDFWGIPFPPDPG